MCEFHVCNPSWDPYREERRDINPTNDITNKQTNKADSIHSRYKYHMGSEAPSTSQSTVNSRAQSLLSLTVGHSLALAF